MDPYDDKTLAEALTEAMRAKGFTVPKLAEATGVTERALELLLAERFEELPPAPYVRGYLMKIAEVLGADGQTLWDAYGKYHRAIRRAGHRDALPANRFALPKVSRRLLVGGAAAFLIGLFVALRLFSGARAIALEVNIPEEETAASSSPYLLRGQVRAGDQIEINGVALTPHADGSFEEARNLVPGLNTLVFTVRRPLGGAREFIRQIYYEVSTSSPETF